MLDSATVTPADGHLAWQGPRIDLFDFRINLETHLVGQFRQTWIGNLVTGELLGTGVVGARECAILVGKPRGPRAQGSQARKARSASP
jgi:hypothetical protein